jgi:hypothetical protein
MYLSHWKAAQLIITCHPCFKIERLSAANDMLIVSFLPERQVWNIPLLMLMFLGKGEQEYTLTYPGLRQNSFLRYIP